MCDLCDGTTFCQLNVCSDCKGNIDNMEQNFNRLQQLRAEIAALALELDRAKDVHPGYSTVDRVVEKMRQLSAV